MAPFYIIPDYMKQVFDFRNHPLQSTSKKKKKQSSHEKIGLETHE
jgi:hypothetical protein